MSGEPWQVAVADTPELRRRGLQGVEDLGELDGMLFVFPAPTESAFTMRGTRMAIDIAFFGSGGMLVDLVEMVPCREEPCPSYRASGPFLYALEAEAGGFAGVEPLRLDPGSLPAGDRGEARLPRSTSGQVHSGPSPTCPFGGLPLLAGAHRR